MTLTVQKCIITHYAVVAGQYIMILPLKSNAEKSYTVEPWNVTTLAS